MDVFLNDSDWESYSESGSSEDQEETEYSYGGQASSILSRLEESIGKIDQFLSFERGFIHGDLVGSVTDPSGQMGKVVGIDMLVDLESVWGKTIKNVNSKKILKIRSISAGDYVVGGPWLGRVDRVVDKVTVNFDDGGNRVVTVIDQEEVLPISHDVLEDSQYPYYPGQRVRISPSNVSAPASWLRGTWKQNQDEGTVCAVEAGLVYVDWLESAPSGGDLSLPTPPCLQDPKNLTLLSCFSYANWQLGDWCILPRADSEGEKEHSTGQLIKEHKNLASVSKARNSNIDEIFVIVKTKTKVDVVWQDGSYSFGLDSQNLLLKSVVNDCEFLPEQFVLEKGTCEDPHMSSSHRWGVVQSMDAKERTVRVRWKTFAVSEASNLDGGMMEETLSAYELVEHPEFSYCFGDVVFRLVKNQFGDSEDKDLVTSETCMGEEAALKCNKDQNQYPDKSYLSCIGNVTGFKGGSVEVRWATGLQTKVTPDEIFRMDKYEGSAAIPVLYEENVEESNQEMIEHDKESVNHTGKVKRVWLKKVQQEWSILEKDLPETIYVRVFDERMDLLRAAIVGAPGTPYHDGLFFFDIFLPLDYPYQPPVVHYNSGGLRVNPNLYESGKVCLSLLNTWTGTGSEVWNPESSTILQVLLSLQALVLNDKPYFNEAGYEKQIGRAEGERNSISYNENAFLVTCKSMLYLLRNPPKHFEALVEEHFRRCSLSILSACKAYMEGAPVASYAVGCGKTEGENLKGSSTGFKIMLAKLLPKLVKAFSDKGIDCNQFIKPEK
ncbi:hypothetical protein I3843_10G048500 [Carya illinoinensis]|nr:hypothetical protein I3843_10G048500 [Carya illinoinensis]